MPPGKFIELLVAVDETGEHFGRRSSEGEVMEPGIEFGRGGNSGRVFS